MRLRCRNKRGQITVFIILALVIIGLIGGYFFLIKPITPNIPTNIAPVYSYYTSCIEQAAKNGASIMSSQGGYLELPEFSPGSTYAPFSSQLGFMGLAIPYWYYISSNGLQKEQIPTKAQMQIGLANYIQDQISKCDFASFELQGYNITTGDAVVKTVINDADITVNVNQKLSINYQDASFSLNNHKIDAVSRLGAFYNLAKQIYDYEQKNMFLENYTSDILYTYAPVSGAIINCSPAVWSPYSVVDKLKSALENNIQSIKMVGNYYTSNNQNVNYFIAGKDANIDLANQQVSFMYSKDWPSRFEIWPTKNNLMMAQPIGNQAGLGIMGFCYIPYKFVYDLYFPVLVQIYNPSDANDIFQFPVAIVINKNVIREPLPQTNVENPASICDNANTDIEVNTLNINLEPVSASVDFKCLDDTCPIGKTKIDNLTGVASLTAKVPQCINGILIASADGYKDKKQLISTNEEYSSNIVLDREYKLAVEVYVDGVLTNDMAVISVNENLENSSVNSGSVAYPSSKEIKLAETDYTFDVKVYGKGNVIIPASTSRQCVTSPKSGIAGFFGSQEEKCFDVTAPAQTMTNILTAGGTQRQYITSGELDTAKILRIYAKSVKAPTNLESIQTSYDEVQAQKLEVQLI